MFNTFLLRNSIIYSSMAFACWISPSIVQKVGPRLSMGLAAVTYLFYLAQFFYLEPISIYISNSILGIGAAIIWTAQVHFQVTRFFKSV